MTSALLHRPILAQLSGTESNAHVGPTTEFNGPEAVFVAPRSEELGIATS